MLLAPEIRSQIEEIHKRCGYLWRYLDVPKKQSRIEELEAKMGEGSFWDDPESAQTTISEANRLKTVVNPLATFKQRADDLLAMQELVDEADETDGAAMAGELREQAEAMMAEVDSLEISSFLSGELDANNAILTIHAGAGGTESCDWAEMLLRMYTRWGERRGFTVSLDDLQQGEEAGVREAILRLEGPNAYGYAKAERGVHRLVRISPFDAQKRRHTSFCSVDIVAEVDDDIDLEINDEDLRVDTYRSSGKGGQHVNRTESAVRLTHLPTGIVAACQNERSQHKNKATAMRMLKSKLYEKLQDEKRSEMERFYGEKGEIGWGNQIRSYVFQPYQMVKDLRTGSETGNIQAVMDGDIDLFINAWLRAGGPRTRAEGVKLEDD
ncbi:MAG: peptide chain release factor 2 [Opitutales bacterium]